jgi:hypothetical protein
MMSSKDKTEKQLEIRFQLEREMKKRIKLPKKKCVLRRVKDGKFLEVWGGSIKWGEAFSHACPMFASDNLGKMRSDDFHKSLWVRFTVLPALRSAKRLECEDMLCEPHYLQ